MSTPQQRRREWPEYLGLAALVVFTLVVPFLAFMQLHWLGPRTPAQIAQDSATGYVIAASDGLAIVLASIAAFAGGRAARVMAAITIPIAFVGLVAFGALLAR